MTGARRMLLSRGLLGGLLAAIVWAGQAAYALPVCTTTVIGGDDFNGVDGSSDANVIAVSKDGGIVRFDGSGWSPMSSPTTEDLYDVHVVADGVAFAVGKDGEVLELNGTTWTRIGGMTNEDLNGVWAASATEVWVVGRKGEIHFYDGSTWTEVSGAASTSNDDLEDAWGDAASFYAMDGDGDLYRYDRGTGFWDAPDTTCAVNNNFQDLWGDAAGNLFLVHKKQVWRHDGSTCTQVASSNEDLIGISGTDVTGEIYAVGKKGDIVWFDGSVWQSTQYGNEDLRDVWVSDTGSAYYAGKDAEVTVCAVPVPNVVGDWRLDDCTLDNPGSVVVDSGANGLDGTTVGGTSLVPDGQLCVAAGLDGSTGYVSVPDDALLDVTDGLGFALWVRHGSGVTSNWQTVFAKGDSAYRLHLNGGCAIADDLPGSTTHGITFGLNGGCGGAELNSNVVPAAGVWYHVAGSYDRNRMKLYVNGTLTATASYTAAIGANNFGLGIGENPQTTGRHWDGDIDEFTLWDNAITAQDVTDHMNRTRPCTNCGGPEFVVTHDNYGIHCLDETVRVDVVNSVSGTPLTDYNATVTLDTQNGNGDWVRIGGSGNFDNGAAGDGQATYDWPLGESTATFALAYRQGPVTLNVDVYQSSDPSVRDDDGEGDLTFSASGFTLSDAALSNPPPATIVPFSGPRIAGTDMTVHIAAYGQTANDPQCGVIETYTGARNLSFWSGYDDPATGTRPVTVDGVAVATGEGGASAQAVTFANGQASVVARYKDAGAIRLSVKDATPVHPDLPNGIRGATPAFVVKPERFVLSGIADGAGNPNPGAADASGAVFVAAGEPFQVTVTALDAEGDPTPNYGQESTPETVALSGTLVAPVAGNNPSLSAATGFGAFSNGVATATDYTWPEVGILQLAPAVGDGDYLGGGNVTGPPSGNVGRFIPARFDVGLNAPAFATACAGGEFTYLGEPFGYAIAPQITVTARAVNGALTQNYTGAFFRLTNTSVANRAYAMAGHSLDLSGLPAASVDPAIADAGAGTGTLTFDAGSGLIVVRGAPIAPFDADIDLSIDVIDLDGVTPLTNPVVFGGGGGIAFDAGANMRYGRVRFDNAIGSERVNLPLGLQSQVWAGAATGFVTHTDDVCTAPLTLTLGGYSGALGPGDTCALDTGSPGVSGAGCAAAAPPGQRYLAPPAAGDFNLILAAPGEGNDGTVTVTADAPNWLEYDWDATTPTLEDPSGTATFGIFAGNGRRIYLREVY